MPDSGMSKNALQASSGGGHSCPPRKADHPSRESIRGWARSVWECFPVAVGWTLALFTLFNLIGGMISQGFDANYTWFPAAMNPTANHSGLLLVFSVFLLWSLIRPPKFGARYVITQVVLNLVILYVLVSIDDFYSNLRAGKIVSSLPLPACVLSIAAIWQYCWRLHRVAKEQKAGSHRPTAAHGVPRRVVAIAAGILITWEIFLLSQFYIAGRECRLTQADCIVVMGSLLKEDNKPSVSLRDRTRTGFELYEKGCAPFLVFSGGPGRQSQSEPQAMEQMALKWGVPLYAIIRDELGWSTYDTVRSVKRIMKERGWTSVIVVSHDFHLSRTRLAFRRAGIEISTCPARRSQFYWKEFQNAIRESAAWTYYYFRPLWEPIEMEKQ